MREHLERLAIAHGYVGGWLDYRDYQLSRVGQSYQYDVPVGKRGILAQFAGKRVRLVCVYSGQFRRWVRVGILHDFDSKWRTELLAGVLPKSSRGGKITALCLGF
jgi:hypothetical protein